EDGGPRSLPAFVSAIARTMQNWVDSEQMRMPGYRDRIVSVLLTPQQGGLNLNMSDELIGELVDDGRRAADLLVDAYARPPAEGWARQRAVRFHSLMAMTERLLAGLHRAYHHPVQPPTPSYQQIADGAPAGGAGTSGRGAPRWQRVRTDELVDLAARWTSASAPGAADPPESFRVDEPTPAPVWRAQPEL
ncbi:hypothetical protein GTQ99_14445, partial [Kineococcus sp. T13]|nr:hypothetical protein [Kineococcus vitellinus]